MAKQSDNTNPEARKRDADSLMRRRPFVYWGSVGLLVIIVVAFMFFGPSLSRGAGDMSVSFGSYDGKEVAYIQDSYFMNRASMLLQQQESGAQDVNDDYKAYRQAFEDTVFHYAIMKVARDLGISVSKDILNKKMASAFVDEKGKFSSAKLEATSAAQRTNMEIALREDETHNLVLSNVLNAQLTSDAEKNFFKSTYQKQRSFNLVTFSKDDYPDSEVVAFAKTNPTTFAQLNLSNLTVAKRDLADGLRKQLNLKTATFEDLVKANSTDDSTKERGGKRDPEYYYQIQNEFPQEGVAAALKNLKPGEYSDVIQDGKNFVIFRADALPVEPKYDDATFVSSARAYISDHEKGKLDDYLVKKAKELSVSAAVYGLAVGAIRANKTVLETGFFPINVSDRTTGFYMAFPLVQTTKSDKISDAQDKDQFFEAAFKLKRGEISDPVILFDQVILLSLKDEKEGETQSGSTLDYYISSAPTPLFKQFTIRDIQHVVIDKKKLRDNFDNMYARYFLQNR